MEIYITKKFQYFITLIKNFLFSHFIKNKTQPFTISLSFFQNSFPEKVDITTFQLLFSMLYALVWFCAIAGNLCVIYVVTLKQVSLSSVRSVFICSLAVSDIFMSLTSLPVTAISIFTRDWVFPPIFCKLIGVFQVGSGFWGKGG